MHAYRNSGPLCFFFGLGAGIAATMLLAPRSGAATRRLIGRTVADGTDWMKDKAVAAQDYLKGQGEEALDRVKGRVKDRVKEVAEVLGS